MVLKCIEASTSWICGMFDQLGTGTGQSCGISPAKAMGFESGVSIHFQQKP
jgi:hypothetical protein